MAYYIPFLHARRNAGRQNRGSPSGRRSTDPREGQNQQQLVTETTSPSATKIQDQS